MYYIFIFLFHYY